MDWFLSRIRQPHVEENVMRKTKTMSYQSLKCIIQHMDVNRRFFCASYLPPLRNIHKATPLKIEFLKMESSSFTVNDIEYSFTSIVEENLKRSQKSPKNSKWGEFIEGRPFDVNKFGLEDTIENLTQGDIIIEAQRHDYLSGVETIRNPVKCSSYICCNVTNKTNDSKLSLRLPKGLQIRNVLRQQIQNFLTGRCAFQVKRLEIDYKTGIWRLPHQIKFHIQELGVRNFANAMIESIRPILDKTSFPLKNLSVKVHNSDDIVFQNEILKTSESLDIKNCRRSSLADVLINLTNKKIHMSGHNIRLPDIVSVARNWIQYPRCIGTKFSFEQRPVHKVFFELGEQLGAIEVKIPISSSYVQGFSVPLNSTSELNIYFWTSPITEKDRNPMMIVMEIMSIGSAIP